MRCDAAQEVEDALDAANSGLGEPRLLQQMCSAELKSLEVLNRLRDITAAGRDIWAATGWKYSHFQQGMLKLGQRSVSAYC